MNVCMIAMKREYWFGYSRFICLCTALFPSPCSFVRL